MNNSTKAVTVVITCAIKPDKIAVAKRELEEVTRTVISSEPACHGITVYEDPKEPRRLLIIEHWESEEIFSGPHMQTAHMRTFLEKAGEFLDGTADFGFWREVLRRPD